jgi:DNA-binding transcriptional LysR family regulator
MEKNPGWELYRSFLAVLREGSLSGAARALALTQPTIGRHIKELEARLDLPLFTRAQNGLRPTDAAHAIAPHAEAMSASADTLLRTIASSRARPRSVVRIAASEVVAIEILPEILATLRARHPEVVIELSASDRAEDLLRRESDIAIRMTRPRQSNLVARRLGQSTLGFHAHRGYLERHGSPQDMTQLKDHALIGFDKETTAVRALRKLGLRLGREDFAFRTDSHLAQLAAIRAGFGIGICQSVVARRDPDLLPVLPNDFSPSLDVWIAMHEDLRSSPPMRMVFDHLTATLSRVIGPKKRTTR